MREDLIKYYESTRTHYTSYHNHKEISAWAGLLLFVFISGLVNKIELLSDYKIYSAIGISVFIILITCLIFRYISVQLAMKDLGGSYVAASITFITELLSGKISDDDLNKYLEVKELPEKNAQSKLVLPIKFIEKAEVMNTRARGFQDTTRTTIYGILFSISLLVVVTKWIRVLG